MREKKKERKVLTILQLKRYGTTPIRIHLTPASDRFQAAQEVQIIHFSRW